MFTVLQLPPSSEQTLLNPRALVTPSISESERKRKVSNIYWVHVLLICIEQGDDVKMKMQ